MREVPPPAANGDDDPWGFVTDRVKRDPVTPDIGENDSTATELTKGARLNDAGSESAMQALRRRARPLAIAAALVYLFGLMTEVVIASRFVSELGPIALVIIYPLGAIGLISVALVQIKWIDRIPRARAFKFVTLGYGAAFVIGLIFVAIPSTTVWGTGAVWLIADQLNFLLPLIVWALIGDLFNAGEGRKIYPWITTWQYGGQLIGLAIPALAPLLFIPLGIPLPWLLVVCPIGIVALGFLLPRALKDRSISRGHGRDESLGESFRSAWQFVGGVKAFRAMFVTSIFVFIAGMSLEASFVSSADRILGDAAKLQIVYGGTLVVVFAIATTLHLFYTTKLLERFNIPGSLMVLPIFTISASIVLIAGLAFDFLPVLIIGIIAWWVPRWSIDEVARRASLALVPDEKRARVSFLVDLVPFASGLLVAGGITWIVATLDLPIAAPVIALPFAIVALIAAQIMRKNWQESLLDPSLRRRKRLSG